MQTSLDRLQYLCNTVPALLTAIDNHTFSEKRSPHGWSKKEILGHLIDSATNNHHRFVRGQFEDSPSIFYDQNKWVAYSAYQQFEKDDLIKTWHTYNAFLVQLVKRIDEVQLQKTCTMKDGTTLTLSFLFEDYVKHLEHHLHHIGITV